jgi:hypothetical protein
MGANVMRKAMPIVAIASARRPWPSPTMALSRLANVVHSSQGRTGLTAEMCGGLQPAGKRIPETSPQRAAGVGKGAWQRQTGLKRLQLA